HADGRIDGGDGAHARDAAAGPHDDATVDRLAQDGVGTADVPRAFGRDGGGLDAVAGGLQGVGRVEHDLVARLPAVVQGEVEMLDLEGDPGDVGGQHLERLLE